MSMLRWASADAPPSRPTWPGAGREFWHPSAPRSAVLARSDSDAAAHWAAWSAYLAERREPSPVGVLAPGKDSPLAWALSPEVQGSSSAALLSRLSDLDRGRAGAGPALAEDLRFWLADLGDALDTSTALGHLACAHALARLAPWCEPQFWWDLLATLCEWASVDPGRLPDDDPLLWHLLTGELPLTLAHQFPELRPVRGLAAPARRRLSSGIEDLLDGEGLPHARGLRHLRGLLACWTRCGLLGRQVPGGAWSENAQNQYDWLVRQALRLTRPDGRQPLAECGPWEPGLLEAALDLGGDRTDRQLAAKLVRGSRGRSDRRARRGALPEAAYQSDWAEAAVLRSGWSRQRELLTVLHRGQRVELELDAGEVPLAAGEWSLDVRLDGTRLMPTGDWESVCWIADEDAVYLELQVDVGTSAGTVALVERQMLLARDGRFALLADAVIARRAGQIEYASRWPITSQTQLEPADDTREVVLASPAGRFVALPLALPEWRRSPGPGELAATGDGHLELRQASEGRALFAPLWLDLAPRRAGRPCTWRQLTVGRDRAIERRDRAVGYRVQIGMEQWLVFRSLGQTANRTLLGHNLTSEFLVARFERSGEVETLVEVE